MSLAPTTNGLPRPPGDATSHLRNENPYKARLQAACDEWDVLEAQVAPVRERVTVLGQLAHAWKHAKDIEQGLTMRQARLDTGRKLNRKRRKART